MTATWLTLVASPSGCSTGATTCAETASKVAAGGEGIEPIARHDLPAWNS